MYQVGHYNGREIHTEYYVTTRDITTLTAAKILARQYRADHPESDGWYYGVAVLDEEGTAVWSPDFDE